MPPQSEVALSAIHGQDRDIWKFVGLTESFIFSFEKPNSLNVLHQIIEDNPGPRSKQRL